MVYGKTVGIKTFLWIIVLSESIFVLLSEIIREGSILFWLFPCYHLDDPLCKDPSEIPHEKGEETGDTIS